MAANLNLTVEEYDLWADPKYRAYVSSIDKSLKNFESTSEWADLISALGKLNKVLMAHADRPVVPRRIVISKRLAQCMHPALPSGVHLKALETYDIIFRCIGTTRLSQELFIYSAGLFPLLANAAMNVKPALLNIYETHFIPLEERLRPGLPGFLNGVLPGLEEGSEYYERTNLLLEKVSRGVGFSYFYGCLWECVLANSSVRLPAITFVLNHFNRRLSTEDQLHIMGSKVDVMVQALSFAVLDSSVLVQRSTLDFLLIAFPFNSPSLIRSDLEKIVTSAVNVVLRRDMSLNRRLYLWLLGAEGHMPSAESMQRDSSVTSSDSEAPASYFDSYSKDVLIQALFSCLKGSVQHSIADHGVPHLKPYRLLISLLDKPEIGQAVLDDILIDVFRSLYEACRLSHGTCGQPSKQHRDDRSHQGEILKTANLLFGTLEPHYIWEYLGHHFQRTCATGRGRQCTEADVVRPVGTGRPSIQELCVLTEFLLDVVSVETYVEVQVEHLPKLLRHLATMLMSRSLFIADITPTLKLCSRLLSKIQLPIVPVSKAARTPSAATLPLTKSQVLRADLFDSDAAFCGEQVFKEGDDGLLSPGDNEANGGRLSSHPIALLRSCVKAFQDSFVHVFTFHLFDPDFDLHRSLQQLLIAQHDNAEERRDRLEQLLWTALNCNSAQRQADGGPSYPAAEVRAAHHRVTLAPDARAFVEAFRLSCQILVDFSSLPVCCDAGIRKSLGLPNTDNPEDVVVPEWVHLLLVVSCFVPDVDFQLVAIGCLLELMGLAHSSLRYPVSSSHSVETQSSGRTFSVVIDPLLASCHLEFIHRHTLFSQCVAEILWSHIGQSEAGCLRRCVELLHQVHSLAPDSSIVENVIGESMANDDERKTVTSVQKFSILWHLSRDLPLRASPTGKVRLFDRSLLVMLNCLNKPFGPQRSEVLSWLTHSLQRGDIGAILEPILLILLHPDTARISVQHVSIHSHRPSKQTPAESSCASCRDEEASGESNAKIFAISSVEGQVIYHVGGSLSREAANTGSSVLPTIGSRPIFALSSLTSEGRSANKVVTANANLSDFDLPSSCERGGFSDPICVTVNPFVSTSSSWSEGLLSHDVSSGANLYQAHRIDVMAIRHASSFDDVDLTNRASADDRSLSLPSLTVRTNDAGTRSDPRSVDMVVSILDELLDNVFSGDDDSASVSDTRSPDSNGCGGRSEVEPPSTCPPVSDAHSLWEGLHDVSVHPLHTYLLLYSQCYDSRRVLYALSTLKGVLQANARAAVCAMATTGIGSSHGQRQSILYEMLARHRKAVFGKGFQGELASDATTVFRSSMYLEVMITVCVYFMRSFYPNLAHMRLGDEDLTDNWEVQLLSVELLTILFAEVATVVRDSGRGFASYIASLLEKCKVQKVVLHCVLAGIYRIDPHVNVNSQRESPTSRSRSSTASTETFTEAIIRFNEVVRPDASGGDSPSCDFQETFQIGMLRLLLVLVILEDQLANHNVEGDVSVESSSSYGDGIKTSRNGSQSPPQTCLRYQPGVWNL